MVFGGAPFIKAGLLTALDLTMFGTWRIWYSKRDVASRAVDESGVVVLAPTGSAIPIHQSVHERHFDVLESDASDLKCILFVECLWSIKRSRSTPRRETSSRTFLMALMRRRPPRDED